MKAVMVMVLAVGASACGVDSLDGDRAGDDPGVESPGTAPPGAENPVALSSRELGAQDWLIEGLAPESPTATDTAAGDDVVAGAAAAPGAVTPATRCVIVMYCDAPGPDGTRCVQQGCSLIDALDECADEAPRECLHLTCPWVLVARGGKRFVNGSCR